MPVMKMGRITAETPMVVGGTRITEETLRQLITEQSTVSATGVVLGNGKLEGILPIASAVPGGPETLVKITASVTIIREPMTEAESAEMNKLKAEGTAKRNQRAAEEQAERERDLNAAARYGREGVLEALTNVNKIAQAASTLNKMIDAK